MQLGLKPVMQFEARLIATKPLTKGALVGYRGRYQAPADSVLGIISAGYGDGYTRHFQSGTPVLINGRKVPLIGNVSMDMIAVDLGVGATTRSATLRLVGRRIAGRRGRSLGGSDSLRTDLRCHEPRSVRDC